MSSPRSKLGWAALLAMIPHRDGQAVPFHSHSFCSPDFKVGVGPGKLLCGVCL